MNGELMNMIQMTLIAKYYIRTGEFNEAILTNNQIESMHFIFAEQDFGKKAPAAEASNKKEWCRLLAERGVEDVKLMVIDEVDNFDKLALVNRFPCFMLCFYDGGVTAWHKKWSFNAKTSMWNVEFEEKICYNAPSGKPEFYDMSQPFVTLLERIRGLSQKLGLGEFSFKFSAALGALQADFAGGGEMAPVNRRLLGAAVEAYVFGGEGSWNDKAKFVAAGKGLTEEYMNVTKDLYKGIALACMYSVNEW